MSWTGITIRTWCQAGRGHRLRTTPVAGRTGEVRAKAGPWNPCGPAYSRPGGFGAGPHGGPPETFGAVITGTATVACLAAYPPLLGPPKAGAAGAGTAGAGTAGAATGGARVRGRLTGSGWGAGAVGAGGGGAGRSSTGFSCDSASSGGTRITA